MEKGNKYIDSLANQLELVKQKQQKVLKEEEAQKPKLTHDMIRQIRQAYTTSKEDREMFKEFENNTITRKIFNINSS